MDGVWPKEAKIRFHAAILCERNVSTYVWVIDTVSVCIILLLLPVMPVMHLGFLFCFWVSCVITYCIITQAKN